MELRQPRNEFWGTSRGLNSVKGLLILLVVFGHMRILQTDFRHVYDLLYIFHVAGFLLLPFLLPANILNRQFIITRTIRYGVPFTWCFTVSTVLFYVVFLRPKGISLEATIDDYAVGLFTASSRTLDEASGLKLLWFLPALLTLTLMRAFWASATKVQRTFLLGLTLGITLLAGEFGDWRYYVPWGLIIAAFIFPLGLLTEKLFTQVITPNLRLIVIIASFVLLSASWYVGISINLGDLTLDGIISKPAHLLLYISTMLMTVWAIFLTHQVWERIPGLAFIGVLSLPVYLVHAWVNQAVQLVFKPHHYLSPLTNLMVTFPVVVAVSVGLSWVVYKLPTLRHIFFPSGKQPGGQLQKAL